MFLNAVKNDIVKMWSISEIMSLDATTLLAYLNRVSKHFDLDFDQVLEVCELDKGKRVLGMGRGPQEEEDEKGRGRGGGARAKEMHLEIISINKKSHLYDPESRRVYSNEKRPQWLGVLCPASMQLVRKEA
jgi:hypothetical protein